MFDSGLSLLLCLACVCGCVCVFGCDFVCGCVYMTVYVWLEEHQFSVIINL